MLTAIKKYFSKRKSGELHEQLEALAQKAPAPVIWLFGKTQSGKTSIIRFLTGAADAEIGRGFEPCTRFSREYRFPSKDTPLVDFLDTRGLEEPDYDPGDDLQAFDARTHLMIVTARVLDFALAATLDNLHKIRKRQKRRPVVLALTCLHEAYPQKQHPHAYPFDLTGEAVGAGVPDNLRQAIQEQRERFAGLVDYIVPIDLTPPEEGFLEPNYGGEQLKKVLIEALPRAYRQTLLRLDELTGPLQDIYERRALPHILGYSTLAATAGAFPIPWADLFVLPGIQTQMVFHLARLYGQPLTGARFLEFASAIGLGMLVRQGIRELVKFIPFLGSVAGAALAGSATFALGKVFCFYYAEVHKGHVPSADDLKQYYRVQLSQAQKLWSAS